ncbi:MAG TPA: N-acetyltransferase [Trebonia sp.]
MLIRRETDRDVAAIRAVTVAAFRRPRHSPERVLPEGQVPDEAPLVDGLRASDAWLPPLSMVAVTVTDDEEIIGHVVCTRGHVDGEPVLGLGPVSVHPDHQARGVGSALMHTVLGAADALGEPLVALLGDPEYYRWFGFRKSTVYGITPPEPGWRDHFQARPLSGYTPGLRGTFRYPAPFDGV